MKRYLKAMLVLAGAILGEVSPASAQHLAVALNGAGNSPTIRAAVNGLPDASTRQREFGDNTTAPLAAAIDTTAEKMLVYQRAIGGWPKAVKEKKVDYKAPLSAAVKAATLAAANAKDATIDNNATTREIEYLVQAYKTTGNAAYRASAEKGIRYLLNMQHKNGGFPQFYPDSSGYRAQITYNDNAMVRVLTLLKAVAERKADYAALDTTLATSAQQALDRGVSCILKTQYVQRGKLTVWCAQHDRKTLLPVKARAFELASLSGMESVGIVQFLLTLDNPSPAMGKSISAAIAWFLDVQLEGFAAKDIVDATQPSGRDRVIVPQAGSVIWARFYDLETNKPIYVGRDGQKKSALSEIENERRAGYVYASTWPLKLLTKDYPKWQQKWEKKEGSKI